VIKLALESVGACELSYEVLNISEELKTRNIDEFDEVDAWRLMKAAENIISVVGKIQFLKHLHEEERKIL